MKYFFIAVLLIGSAAYWLQSPQGHKARTHLFESRDGYTKLTPSDE